MRLATAGAASAFALGAGASAESYLQPPPDRFITTETGVDMRSGRYAYSKTDLSIGGEGGLELTRTPRQLEVAANPFGYFSHNFDIVLTIRNVNIAANDYESGAGSDLQVQIGSGGLADTFRKTSSATGYTHASKNAYAILTNSGGTGNYIYEGGDGSLITFNGIGSGCGGSCATPAQLTRADGTGLTFAYNGSQQLVSVVSTRGHAVLFEYANGKVSKACALNLARVEKPASNLCPAGVPTATYGYDNLAGELRLAKVTDPSGAQWGFVNAPASGGSTMGFVNPGETSPWLTNTLGLYQDVDGRKDIVTAQSFADGQSYVFGYYRATEEAPSRPPPLAGGYYTDADGRVTDVEYSFPPLMGTAPGDPCQGFPCLIPTEETVVYQMTAGPTKITDPLGRITQISYADPVGGYRYLLPQPQSMTDPGGVKTKMVWDLEAAQLLQTTQIPKTGSGLANLVKSATYMCGPGYMKQCGKPTSTTDAKGNVTNYTYSTAHGGVLTEMKPAPASGAARPLKLTTWIQKYAYVLSGGSLIPAASPAWVMASETVCQTAAGTSPSPVCDAAAPQRVTTYEYGANGTANNLFVRGIAVTADGATRRTCFTYDDLGRRISETKPRGTTGLTTCA